MLKINRVNYLVYIRFENKYKMGQLAYIIRVYIFTGSFML